MYTIAKSTETCTFKTNENILKCEAWINNGITVFLHNNNPKPPHFRFVVNPRINIKDYNYMGIFNYNSIDMLKVISNINDVLNLLGTVFCFNDMTLSRIDLCVNLEFNDTAICNEYMRLIRKCMIPNNYQRFSFNSDVHNYKEKNINSFRISKEDIVSITIYEKIFQLTQDNRLPSDKKIPSGLIRIEVGLLRHEIRKISKLYSNNGDLTNINLMGIFGNTSKAIMKDYIYDLFPSGIYMRFNCLIEFILRLNVKNKIRKRIKFLVEKTSDCNNINNSLNKMCEELELSESKCEYILNLLEQYGVNPISLPNKSYFLALAGLRELLGYEECRINSIFKETLPDF